MAKFLIKHSLSFHHIRNSYMSIHKKTHFTFLNVHAYHNTKLLFFPNANTLLITCYNRLSDANTYLAEAISDLNRNLEDCIDSFHGLHRQDSTWVQL